MNYKLTEEELSLLQEEFKDSLDENVQEPIFSKSLDSLVQFIDESWQKVVSEEDKNSNGKDDDEDEEEYEDEEVEKEYIKKEDVELVKDTDVDFTNEQLQSIFGDKLEESQVEEFVSLFKTFVAESANSKVTSIVEKANSLIKESVKSIEKSYDKYATYAVNEWIEKNKIAVKQSMRHTVNEDFVLAVHNLFKEHFINIPEEKEDLVETQNQRIEELQSKLNEKIEAIVNLSEKLNEHKKNDIVNEFTSSFSDVQKDKFLSLVESITFTTEEEFKNKLESVKKTFVQKTTTSSLDEQLKENVGNTQKDEEQKYNGSTPEIQTLAQILSMKRY